MNMKINPNELRPPSSTAVVAPVKARELGEANVGAAGVKPAAANVTDAEDAAVEITGATRQLLDLVKAGDPSAAVDMAKVERLRAAIADGSYQVNAREVADRLVRFEFLLGRVTGELK